MGQIKVTLRKFNNQSKQYDEYLTLQSTIAKLTAIEVSGRTQVEGFYLYEYTIDSRPCKIYSVSPMLLD